jgi:WD40 repeat protein
VLPRARYLQLNIDEPGDLVVSGCEWHISPQGWSYFVNHNIRTTSWKKPIPERPAESLTLERIIEGHPECIWRLACVGTSYNVMSASGDGSIRQWTRDGKPVGKSWHSDGGVKSLTVSADGTMAASGSADGRLRLWNIKEGKMVGDPWEMHTTTARCLDWSPNGLEVASGSKDGTVKRWNPDAGQQIGPTIDTGHDWVNAIKYSPQSDKIASGGDDSMIRVWSKDGKLLIEIKGHDGSVTSLCWSKDGAHIFSGSVDGTIRKWQLIDGKEVFVLRGHTHPVTSICVSPDERHLISASQDYSVRIWDLKTNQQVGDPLLHDDELFTVVLSSDGRYVASAGLDKKIYIWSLEAALKQDGAQVRAHIAISLASSLIGFMLWQCTARHEAQGKLS